MEPPSSQIIDLFAALKASLNPTRKAMDSRRQETATAASTTDTTTTISETPSAAAKRDKGTTTDGVKAGQLFEKLQQIDTDEQAELAQSPSAIRAKHEERRQRELGKASDAVKALVSRMRATT